MKWMKWLCAVLFVLLVIDGTAFGRISGTPFQIVNRLRLEYDDNIRQQEEDKDSSFKVIEEIEIHADMNLEQTFIGLRYRPSFVLWGDRPEDETDIHHDLDFILNHTFTPRLALSLKDTFRLAELPELIEDGAQIRENNDFIYNTANGTLSVIMRPDTRLEVAGRHVLLRYDDEDVADREDYDIVMGGLSLRHQIVQETSVAGELRYESQTYEGEDDRGADTAQIGLGLEQIFSQNLLGSVRGGYSQKEFEDSDIDSESAPYGDVELTILASPATRMTLGAGYSFFEAGVYPFANQERTRVFASLAHDFTAKIAGYLSAVYTVSDYDEEQQVTPPASDVVGDSAPVDAILDEGGSEEVVQISARLTYQVNRSNWLEVGWQYSQLESDFAEIERPDGTVFSLREEFERNRISVGWKVSL